MAPTARVNCAVIYCVSCTSCQIPNSKRTRITAPCLLSTGAEFKQVLRSLKCPAPFAPIKIPFLMENSIFYSAFSQTTSLPCLNILARLHTQHVLTQACGFGWGEDKKCTFISYQLSGYYEKNIALPDNAKLAATCCRFFTLSWTVMLHICWIPWLFCKQSGRTCCRGSVAGSFCFVNP